MSFSVTVSDWIAKLVLALVAMLIGSAIGRHLERRKAIRERAAWLGYENSCEAFAEDGLEPGHGFLANPLCIRCGFRWNDHAFNARPERPDAASDAIPNEAPKNGSTPIPVATSGLEDTTALQIPHSRKDR